MATSSSGQLDPVGAAMRAGHQADDEKTQRETSTITTFTASNHTSSIWLPQPALSSSKLSASQTSIAHDNNSFEIQIAARPKPHFLRRFLPRKTKKKLPWGIVRRLSKFGSITIPIFANRSTGEPSNRNIDDHIQQQLRHILPDEAIMNTDNDHDRGPRSRSLYPPHNILAIESDTRSMMSGSSDSTNEYNLMGKVEGTDEELLISFDSQCPTEIIFSPALEKFEALANIKRRDIPTKRRKPYMSPLNPNTTIIPTEFVRLWIYLYELGVRVEVDLKIMEVPEELNGFQVILGRKFLRTNGGFELLRKIEEVNRESPNSVMLASNTIAPLREAHRSKKQTEHDKAREQALRARQRQQHAELYRSQNSPPQLSLGSSSYGSGVGGSRVNHWVSHDSVEYQANPLHQVNNLPGPYYALPAAQQSTKKNTAPPESPVIQRADTSDSASSQFTQFSFGRQETVSSTSSWGDVPAYAPKEGEPAFRQGAQQGGPHTERSSGQ